MNDRRVHARYPGMEIVRYDRAGKWYFEPVGEFGDLPRQHVGVGAAARLAAWGLDHGGEVFLRRPGGKAFDSKFREAVEEKQRRTSGTVR